MKNNMRQGFKASFLFLIILTTSCSMSDDVSSSPDGSAASPWEIDSAEELYAVRGDVEGYDDWSLDDNYKLTADIDLSDYDWDPIGSSGDSFTGSLNGDGHTISNLSVSKTSSALGLFGSISPEGYVEDLTIEGSVSGRSNIGLLAGVSEGTISDCAVSGYVTASYYNGGGLVGSNYGDITDSYASVEVVVSGTEGIDYEAYVGGLVGYSEGSLTGSYATGSVTGEGNYVGGLVGYLKGSVYDCYATGNVAGSSDYVGGLLGYSDGGTITSSFAMGEVSSEDSSASYVKAFVSLAENSSTFSFCYYNAELAMCRDNYATDTNYTTISEFEEKISSDL
jgi:hypothetical protein